MILGLEVCQLSQRLKDVPNICKEENPAVPPTTYYTAHFETVLISSVGFENIFFWINFN